MRPRALQPRACRLAVRPADAVVDEKVQSCEGHHADKGRAEAAEERFGPLLADEGRDEVADAGVHACVRIGRGLME